MGVRLRLRVGVRVRVRVRVRRSIWRVDLTRIPQRARDETPHA